MSSTALGSSALPPIGEDDLSAKPQARTEAAEDLDVETQFANLKSFYQSQLADASDKGGLSSLGELGIGSPGSLSRIMSLYTGTGLLGDKKAKSRSNVMREALEPEEGLKVADLDETKAIERLHRSGWDETASTTQAASQPPANVCEPNLHGRSRFVDELRPVAYLLRTKRSKRCPVCRHIVSKPEAKVTNTRFRIRLVAGSYIPTISMRPLQATSLTQSISGNPFAATTATSMAPAGPPSLLAPLRPVQYLLTFKNPIFEPVRVTLATPSVTPGRFASKVTVLCPEFEIDANTDVWDEALKDRRSLLQQQMQQQQQQQQQREDTPGSGTGQPSVEPGKVWERGRNWVTIVVEVVPASLELARTNASLVRTGSGGWGLGIKRELDMGPLRPDEDVLEIPMFVRLEWETDAAGDEGRAGDSKADGREKRELAYWCVMGLGRISQD